MRVKILNNNINIIHLRARILKMLRNRTVIWFNAESLEDATATVLALIKSRQFRSHFLPLITDSVIEEYREYLAKGGWGERSKYRLIDRYDELTIRVDTPSLIVSRTPPITGLRVAKFLIKKE